LLRRSYTDISGLLLQPLVFTYQLRSFSFAKIFSLPGYREVACFVTVAIGMWPSHGEGKRG